MAFVKCTDHLLQHTLLEQPTTSRLKSRRLLLPCVENLLTPSYLRSPLPDAIH